MEQLGKILIVDDNEDVLFALNVPQSRTLAVVQRNREPAVGVHYIFVFFAF